MGSSAATPATGRPATTTPPRATGATTAPRSEEGGRGPGRRHADVPHAPAGSTACTATPWMGGAERARADPRRRRRPRRSSRRGPHPAGPALRLPDPQAPLRPLHARSWSREVCGCTPEEVVRVAELLCANSGRERTSGDRLRGRLDAAHHRRADHPRGRHPAAAARQHGPAGRRDHGDARPLQHPGLDRRPDALRPAARLPAAAGRRRAPRDARLYVEHEGLPTGSGPTSASSSSACSRPGTATRPRRRTTTASTGCRGSTATIRSCRTSTAWPRAR